MGFIIGFLLGAAVAAFAFYKFYHVNVVTDLKGIIDELKITLDKKV